MNISEIDAYLASLERTVSLVEPRNFEDRSEVLGFLGDHVCDRVADLLLKTKHPEPLLLLESRARQLVAQLEAVDRRLFENLRRRISTEKISGSALRRLLATYVDLSPEATREREDPDYDNLDVFVNGLTGWLPLPDETTAPEPEMIYYQKTPVRIVLNLIALCHFTKNDVFVDLGCGMGQVAMLVHLLAEVPAAGIEFDSGFCAYARQSAAALGCSGVEFIRADVRDADLSRGTVFFLFTPFTGGIMNEVLERLRTESLARTIRLVTYGPCTTRIAQEEWLEAASPGTANIYRPALFTSR